MKKATTYRLMALAALLTVVATLGILSVPKADASCNGYSNSRSAFFFGYGWACAYTGPGCTECVEMYSGGYSVCITSGGESICYDYQY